MRVAPMKAGRRFAQGRPVTLAVLMTLAVLAMPGRLQAQTANESTLSDRNDIAAFATEYTRTVMLGVVGGGVLMNVLVGGGGATLAGALAGSSLASWLFVSLQARHYVIQRTAPHPSR